MKFKINRFCISVLFTGLIFAQTIFAAQSGKIIEWGDGVIGNSVSETDFTKVVSGNYQSAALTQDGSIITWGGSSPSGPSSNGNFTDVALGGNHGLGLQEDGSIIAWGSNSYGESDIPSPNTGFIAIAAGSVHSLGIKADGSIIAWGNNSHGECSIPSPNTDFIAVAAGYGHSLGLKADGSILAWGWNNDGQCDIPAPNTNFIAISACNGHSLGLKADGAIVAWGYNSYGQCDVPSPNTGFVAITAGNSHSLGIKSDGSIIGWGWNNIGQCNTPSPNTNFVSIAGGFVHSLGLKSDGSIVAWGSNEYLQCNVPVKNTNFAEIDLGWFHGLGLRKDGYIVAFGDNDYDQCKIPTPNSDFTEISAGGQHSLGLKTDGSITAWGWNEKGQCNVPTPNSGFIAVAAGDYHSLGIKSDGSIAAWGLNSWGQCNVPAPNTNFTAAEGGGNHSIGLKQDGSVIVWGGDETTRTVSTPNSGFIAVAAGDSFCLALRSDGSIAAWGYNHYGELDVPTPNTDFTAIDAGYNFCLGLKQDGSVIGWGYNFSGQCDVPSPNTNFFAVAAGLSQSFGIVTYSQDVLGGSGTENDPYLIISLADFNEFAANSSYWAEDVHTKLMCDIDLTSEAYTTAVIAADTNNINEAVFDGTFFNGVFDGNNHIILGLDINTGTAKNDFLGLFGQTGPTASIKNLALENISVNCSDIGTNATYFIGSLCGRNFGQISNCKITGSVNVHYSGYIGGLAGQNEDGIISDCCVNTNVTAGDYSGFIGGLVGVNLESDLKGSYATGNINAGYCSSIGGLAGTNLVTTENALSNINNCYATGDVIGGNNSDTIGGLAGSNEGAGASITNSYANAYVTAGTDSYALGGLCGYNKEAVITDCYSNGDVSGKTDSDWIGGLCGYNWDAGIINCYSTGGVQTGNYLGGLCGYHRGSSAIIGNSLWDIETSGLSIGYNLSSSSPGAISNVLGKSTGQMKTAATFLSVDWDFIEETDNGSDDIWRLCENGINYPRLFWDVMPGDFTCPDIINFKDYALLASLWLSESGDTNWRDRYDISTPKNAKIDTDDLLVFCENWLIEKESPVTNDFIAYWQMDEGGGSVITDSSGNGNDGNINGPIWITGKFGNALSFDGTNDYVDIPFNSDFAYTIGQDQLTISAWVYPFDKDTENYGAIYSDRAVGNDIVAVSMKISSGNFSVGGWSPTSPGYSIEATVPASNQWYLMTVVFDSSQVKLFIDGQLKSFAPLTGVSLANGGTGMMLGKNQGGTWSNYFGGRIDDVRIYNKALSDSEVILLINQ